ncbi:hypothetical protein G9F71_010480 [Clostridium sp. FP2]|uniref:hypothetical protein n=1 Tax=Clostridium TaxID=1485 RepID=UPI0013E9414F|nr:MULTISPECIES: hypothetical protein [Clostridium]MBW9158817.1 hypothetical protein [Clostridium tagluense]MBZ9623279.1 hypothetical protein [Clostridium sp. FP2]WLC67431.1 hypothetical protein KTC93_09765 [Clostridium tagluense]
MQKRLREIFAKKKRLLIGSGGLFILIFLVLFNKYDAFFNISNALSKGHPAYIIEEKHFKSIESAQIYIKEIPFVVPQKIKTSYKVKEITYSKTKENSCSVVFRYKDDNNNELRLEYHSKGDNIESNSDFRIVNPDIVRIETEKGYGIAQKATNPVGNTILTSKFLHLELPKYSMTANLFYSEEVNTFDKSDDEMLAGIIEGFLHSEIFYAKTESDIIFDSLTLRFNSFSEFKQSVPLDVYINEPKYIPNGFNFKYIIYKRYKDNPSHVFNITAIYENSEGIQLSINYMTFEKSGIHVNNNNTFEQRNIYKIQCDGNDKGYLIPYTERQLRYQFSNFDMNIYLQYKSGEVDYDNTYDNELRKIVESIEG